VSFQLYGNQEEFYRGAMAAFVVYDLTRLQETLPNVTKWKDRINSFVCKESGDPIPLFLLGNKVNKHMCLSQNYDQFVLCIQCDIYGCYHDASKLATINGFKGHFRTSAKIRAGIDSAIELLVREVSKAVVLSYMPNAYFFRYYRNIQNFL